MNGDEMAKSWKVMSEEVISGVAEWRQQHPKATFREIEEEVDKRLSELRARMLTDAALNSGQAEWEQGSREAVCPNCGAELVKKGKKKRKLQTRGGQEVELEREYGVCPRCGQGIFPPG
jgi:YgiT-type zinc finger domain-containing protein